MRTHRLTPSAFILLLALAGCGADDAPTATEATPDDPDTTRPAQYPAEDDTREQDPDPDPDPDEDTGLPSEEQLREFVDAIAADTAGPLRDAQDLVAPDSPASDYLTYFAHTTEAEIDAGFSLLASDVTEVEDGYEACAETEGKRSCATYTGFTGQEGQIYSFLVEGREIEDRLIMSTGETVEAPRGASLEFVAAYLNANDTHLLVAYELRSGSTGLHMPLTSYRGPEGRQSQSERAWGALNLAPDSMSHYVAMFPGAEQGGELHLELVEEDGGGSSTVVLPTSG